MNFAGSKKETALVIRQLYSADFPFPRCQLFRFSAFIRDGVKMRIARPLRLKIDMLIIFHPSESEGSRPVNPCVIVLSDDRSGFAGRRIERENPAILVISRAAHQNRFRA